MDWSWESSIKRVSIEGRVVQKIADIPDDSPSLCEQYLIVSAGDLSM